MVTFTAMGAFSALTRETEIRRLLSPCINPPTVSIEHYRFLAISGTDQDSAPHNLTQPTSGTVANIIHIQTTPCYSSNTKQAQ
jgi:hypothetical protein